MDHSLTSSSAADAEAEEGSVTSTRPTPSHDPSMRVSVAATAAALLIHGAVFVLCPRRIAVAATPVEVPLEMFVAEQPPPEPPAQEPAPAVIAPIEKPKPVIPVRRAEKAPPPKAAEDTPAPPAEQPAAPPKTAETEQPSEPAPALVAAPDAVSSHSIVASAGGALEGRGTGGNGVVGGTGSGIAGSKNGVDGGTGGGRAQPVTLSSKNWSCPWPEDAEYEDFDQQLVAIKVLVAADGTVEKAEIVSDPGFGFGKAARDCARRVRFTPARDALGNSIRALSPPIHVRFVR